MLSGDTGSKCLLQRRGEAVEMTSHEVKVQPNVPRFVRLQSGQIPKVLNRLEVSLTINSRVFGVNLGGCSFRETSCEV